jgi:hypothetical protein
VAHRSDLVLFHDPLTGPARDGWRVPPTRFEDAPGGCQAFLLEPGEGRTVANPPWVGDETWGAYRIEFDVCATGEKDGWVGPDFHVRDSGLGCCNLQFYSASDRDEVIFESSARWWPDDLGWKLYPMAQRTVRMPKGKWARVRVDVGGDLANVFVGGDAEPCYTVRYLPFSRGGIRLWNYVGSAFLRDLRVTALGPGDVRPVLADPWDVVVGKEVIRGWAMSAPLAEGAAQDGPAAAAEVGAWRDAPTDARGVVLVSAAGREYVDAKRVVLAKTVIDSPDGRTRTAVLTYTDQLTMWLNGAEVFRGERRGWFDPGRSAEGWFGRLKPDQFRADLPLRAGANELLVRLEVNEPLFGSGFWVRVE